MTRDIRLMSLTGLIPFMNPPSRWNLRASVSIFAWIRMVLIISAATAACAAPIRELLITDYGAVGDGRKVNTAAIQKTIDALQAQGGGYVVIPSGRFVTGTLYLKSGVGIYLDNNAELLGSRLLADYPMNNPGSGEIVGGQNSATTDVLPAQEYIQCLIVADRASHVGLYGPGIVDGRGLPEAFPYFKPGTRQLGYRPMLLRFYQCRDVHLDGVTLTHSASWGVHLVDCDDVQITGIKIRNRCQPNNDGIDIDGCRNVFISNSDISSGDDAICPKSSHGRPCENIFVRNCVISSGTAGFKCGTSSRAGFRNIIVSDCIFHDIAMGAIKLECVDGGTLENVLLQNLIMENVEGPIFIRLGDRGAAYQTPPPNGSPVPVGVVRHITLSNIRATLSTRDASRSGILISGIPGHPVSDVKMDNIDITFPGMGNDLVVTNRVPEDEKRYPEPYFFGVRPAYAAYVRHAEDIEFHRVRFHFNGNELRPAVALDDVSGFTLSECQVQAAGRAVLVGCQAADLTITGCRVQGAPAALTEVEASATNLIYLCQNRLPIGVVPLLLKPLP